MSKHWYTDGTISKFCDTCPAGFRPGRIKKPTEVEQRNIDTINSILNSYTPEYVIDFYITNSVTSCIEFFGLSSEKQLLRLLEKCSYDFSKQKPSLLKGKPSTRSHESYVAGGKKSSKTQKACWEKKSLEEKNEWSAKMLKSHASESFKRNIKQINIDYYKNLDDEQKAIMRRNKSASNSRTWKENKAEILEKSYNTKKANNSFNSSKIEEEYYKFLLTKYAKEDIIRQYKDFRYPHACDFYIKPKDLYIELNLNWTHGLHPYDANNPEDCEKLSNWLEKSAESKFYKRAITTWTSLDVQKLTDARSNKLNYLVYYSDKNLYDNYIENDICGIVIM